MEVPSKNSLLSDMGRRPQLKSDEFFEGTPLCSRDNRTFVFETAQESGSVIGGATPLEELHIDIQAALSLPRTQCNLQDSPAESGMEAMPMTNVQDMFGKTTSSHVQTYPDMFCTLWICPCPAISGNVQICTEIKERHIYVEDMSEHVQPYLCHTFIVFLDR